MKLKMLLSAAVAAIVFSAVPHWATAGDPVTVAADAEYPPFNYKNDAGEIVGFDVEITLAACAAVELDCSFVAQAWDGLIPGLLVGKFDAISASMFATEERRKKVDFTEKLYLTPTQFLVPEGSSLAFTAEGLSGKVLAAQRATVQADFLETTFGEVADINLYETQDQANLDLAAGRVDALLGEVIALTESFLESDAGKGFEFSGPEYKLGDGIAIAVSKDKPELTSKLSAGIQAIRDSGQFQEISEKYFGRDIY